MSTKIASLPNLPRPPFEIITEKLSNGDLLIRKCDGYVVASSVCSIVDKKWSDWYKNEKTQEMIQAFAEKEKILPFVKLDIYDPKIHQKSMVESYKKGNNKYQTIIHRRVAIQFAQSNPSIAWELSDVLDKYIRGDLSLIPDLVRRSDELNGTVTQNVQVATTENAYRNEIETRKRKLDEIEFEERAVNLRDMQMTQREREMKHSLIMIDLYKQAFGPEMTEREQIYAKDFTKFILEREIKRISQPLLQIGGPQPILTHIDSMAFQNKEISIALIAYRLNLKLSNHMYSQVGKIMKKLWQQRYKTTENPPKGKQVFQGKVLDVNTYYEEDADLMERAIREVMEKHALKEKRKK
jgi:hypothetical protein